jgi:transposase
MRIWRMRTGISFILSDGDRQRLDAIVAGRNTPQKHVWRARIVLLSADGVGTNAIMAATGKSKTCVWRWQERFASEGVDGLLRDKTRPPGKPPTAVERVEDVVRRTLEPPPHEATHWTLRAMAKAAGLAASTVQAIWKSHGLAPHRWRQFKLSKDPAFAEKLHDVVGLYVAPPATRPAHRTGQLTSRYRSLGRSRVTFALGMKLARRQQRLRSSLMRLPIALVAGR